MFVINCKNYEEISGEKDYQICKDETKKYQKNLK